jgi:hypothetical protein
MGVFPEEIGQAFLPSPDREKSEVKNGTKESDIPSPFM